MYVARRLSARGRRAFLAAADGGATLILDAYGGAINAVPADATAFVHRDARFSVQILSYSPIGTARPRVRRARALIAPFGNGEAYQNYADLDLRSPRRAYYGANARAPAADQARGRPGGPLRPPQGSAERDPRGRSGTTPDPPGCGIESMRNFAQRRHP